MFEKSSALTAAESDRRAAAFFAQGQYQQALSQNQATARLLRHADPNLLRNSAICWHHLQNASAALECFKQYMRLSNSNTIDDIDQLAQYLNNAGRIAEGRQVIETQQHECHKKHLDLGWYLYRDNLWQQAFVEMEIGRQQGNILWIGEEKYKNLPPCPRWHGEPIAGKTVLAVAEGGLGDEFIFSRWLSLLDGQVDYYTNNSLSDVICTNFGIDPYDRHKRYDYWFPMMSLPCLLEKYDPTMDRAYIKPQRSFVEKWRSKIIGQHIAVLSWKGNGNFAEKHIRDIPIEPLVNKLKHKYTLYSVCMEASHCPEGVVDLTKDITCWQDTLAIISLCDISLCSCSSVAHASGALGARTFVYTRPDDYFTWGGTASGGQTPWYKNVTVWRQATIGQWEPIFDQSLANLS